MNSLFAKILLWFWATLVIFVVGAALISALSTDVPDRQFPMARLVSFELAEARWAYETGGRDGLRDQADDGPVVGPPGRQQRQERRSRIAEEGDVQRARGLAQAQFRCEAASGSHVVQEAVARVEQSGFADQAPGSRTEAGDVELLLQRERRVR